MGRVQDAQWVKVRPTFEEPETPQKTMLRVTAGAFLIACLWFGKSAIQVFGQNFDIVSKGTGVETASMIGGGGADAPKKAKKSPKKAEKQPEWAVEMPESAPANNFAVALDPTFAERKGISKQSAAEKLEQCEAYVEKYAPVAVTEMRKFGIPASVTLAQGLLESDAGQSKLARATNNHFGIKCFSRRCAKGHCQNFTDDTHKDFFRTFGSAWGSFRAHSEFLKNGDRYNFLFRLASDDAYGWATGLQKAGYATDKQYARKLLALIQKFNLRRFDK